MMVLFQEAAAGAQSEQGIERNATINEPVAQHLEDELIRTRSQLRNTSEQYEVQTEEFKASNEELHAINEELRSAAEELETSKEELQSVNEELTTVNQELKIKIDELSQTNNDFKNLINATDIGTIFLDRSFGVNLFTPAAREIFNLIPADYGRPLSDITHRLTSTSIIDDAVMVLRKLQPVEREVSTTEGRTYLMRILPYRTSEDQISGVVVTFINITGRIKAEHSLYESLDRTTEILESINDAFYAMDADFKFTYINKKAEELWGRSRVELLGENYWKEFPAMADSEIYDKHQQALRDQHSITYETDTPIPGHWIELRIYPNKLGGLSCYFSDITERKKAEEALRASEERMRIALEAAKLAAWVWDVNGEIVAWNDQHFYLLGREPEDTKITPADFMNAIHPEDKQKVADALQLSISKGSVYDLDFRIIRTDNGEVRWMHGFGQVIEWHEGAPSRMTGVMREITRQKQLERQKDDFIGIASHELRTPVTSIKAYTDVLYNIFSESSDDKAATLVSRLDGQVDRLTNLIKDLLDTSRISEGKLMLQKKTFDLSRLIRETTEMMQYTTKKHRLEISMEALPLIFADEERVGQVLTNLLSNAIKYAPDSEQIDITASIDANEVLICVKDTGTGLSEAVQEKVFERFYRSAEATHSTYPGLGLGLYISTEIAKQHGGSLTVISKSGEGALFCLRLPHHK